MERTAFSRIWILPPLLMVAGAAALFADVRVSEWFRDKDRGLQSISKDLNQVVHLSEAFAEGHAVIFILLLLGVVDVKNRWKMPRLASMSLGAGMFANLIKLFVARARPYHFFKEMQKGIETISSEDIWTTFRQGWLGLNFGESKWQSLPSSHAATAVGLAVGLTWLYPRGKWMFAFLAMLACAQRIGASYHFLSDVCWGAAAGSGVAWFCLRVAGCQRFFDWIENRPHGAMNLVGTREKMIEPLPKIR